MKIPKRVNIFSVIYDVEIVDDPRSLSITEDMSGVIMYHERKIKIYKNGSWGIMQTLLHEIIHGIIYHLDIDVRDDEKICNQIATGLSDVLIRNSFLK